MSFAFFVERVASLGRIHVSWERTLLLSMLQLIRTLMFSFFTPLLYFTIVGPLVSIAISAIRVIKISQGAYGSGGGDASKANLKPALNLFYYASLAHGAIYILYMTIEMVIEENLMKILSQRHGFSPEVLDGYLHETKKICASNPASIESWNLITYGVGLLDSQLPEDYAYGGKVITMLIDQDKPAPKTWLLTRSPKQKIQKLIRTLAWRSPADREMRWFAARIVEHLAGHISIAHFPGALGCISSLFDTSCHSNGDREALHLPFAIGRINPRKKKNVLAQILDVLNQHGDKDGHFVSFRFLFCQEWIHKKRSSLENDEGIDGDLVLPGLRILEKLAHDRDNCELIYNTKYLLSKIVAPISSNELTEDIKNNVEWTKVVDVSLKVVSRLMGSSGSTGEEMRSLIAKNSNVVENLEAILDKDMKSSNGIIELQMQAIEVLTQLALHERDPATATTSSTKRREKLIKKALDIFLTTDWMREYLEDEKNKIEHQTTSHVENKMKEAKETASQLKEKAGEALAMLSSDSKAIKSFSGCKDDDVHRLTEFLDSKIKTIKCQISATDTLEIEINISWRISAAVILKHMSNYVKEPTLRRVLAELLPVQADASSTPGYWQRLLHICCWRNDIESGRKDEPSASQRHHIQLCGERRLQAELISLVTAVRPSNNLDFAVILMSQTPPVALEDFVVRLKKIVEDNLYATPACLAIHKLTCEMVIEFIKHDRNVEVIEKHDIIGTLLEASKMMARLESNMLFAGIDRDCHGVPLKPLSSVLAKKAANLLAQRKQALGLNTAPASAPVP